MTNPSMQTATIIYRPLGNIAGYRTVYDRATRVVIHAFPLGELGAVTSGGLLTGAGAYVLTDLERIAYIGETGRPQHRLVRHSADPAKAAYARHAFVVSGCTGSPFDKSLILDLQFRLTGQVLKAGVVALDKGTNPVEPALSDADRATHDRIYEDALRLLHDAGCRIFQPAAPDVARPPAVSSAEEVADDIADSGPISIGVSTTPLGCEEFEIRYCGLWGRGYPTGDHFVVAAGSEVRSQTNGSVDTTTRLRREELFRAGVLAAIPGVEDRRRLMVAVAFPTRSIAAKILCGAHTPGRWATLTASRAVVLAT